MSSGEWRPFCLGFNVLTGAIFFNQVDSNPFEIGLYVQLELVGLINRDLQKTSWDGNASLWASYQIREIAGCACAGNAGKVFPATTG